MKRVFAVWLQSVDAAQRSAKNLFCSGGLPSESTIWQIAFAPAAAEAAEDSRGLLDAFSGVP